MGMRMRWAFWNKIKTKIIDEDTHVLQGGGESEDGGQRWLSSYWYLQWISMMNPCSLHRWVCKVYKYPIQ